MRDQAEQQRADRRAAQRAHPADDHDDQRVQQPLGVVARCEAANEPPITPPMPARREPTKNAIAKTSWMLMPSAGTIVAVVDAGADHDAHAGALEPQPQADADGEADRRA